MGSISSKGFLNGQPFPADCYDYISGNSASLGTFLNQKINTGDREFGDVKYVKIVYNNLSISSKEAKQAQTDQNEGKLDKSNEMKATTVQENCGKSNYEFMVSSNIKNKYSESGNIENDGEECGSVKDKISMFNNFNGPQKMDHIVNDNKDIKNEIEVMCEYCSDLKKNMHIYHAVIIIQANNRMFWSIEKTDKRIIVQRSKHCKDILKNLCGKSRSEELRYDDEIEKLLKKEYKEDDCTTMPHLRDVLTFVSSTETQLGYHSLSRLFNCQGFLKRTVDYIYERDVRRSCDLLNNLQWKIKSDLFFALLVQFYENVFRRPKEIYIELKEKSDAIEKDKRTM